jgi:hypothetical protein
MVGEVVIDARRFELTFTSSYLAVPSGRRRHPS